jgi:CBS domain-containing protein
MENISRFEIGTLLSPILSTSAIAPISKIVGILREQNAYEVFFEANKRVGMVTTRDILKASNITTSKVNSISMYVPTLTPNSTIQEAAQLMMDYRIRALPVVDGNALVGSIQALSIIKLMHDRGFLNTKARDIMTANPVTITSNSLASKARTFMIRRKFDHLPVLTKKELAGVLTSSQIVFNVLQISETIDRDELMSEQQRQLEFPVKDLLEGDTPTCDINDDITLVFEMMTKQDYTCAIATLWDEIQGIITYRDFMKLITTRLRTTSMPIYIVGLPEDPFEAEMAKSKFIRGIKRLERSFPFIEEAAAVIKTYSEGNKERRRYEVKVSIITPKRTYAFSEKGWELSQIFDTLANKFKKTLSQRPPRRVSIRG